jgi:hypothetical protein
MSGRENVEDILLFYLIPSFNPIRSSNMWIEHLVPVSSVHVYGNDMRIEVLWNQNPISLSCVFVYHSLDSVPSIPINYYGEWIKEGESLISTPLVLFYLGSRPRYVVRIERTHGPLLYFVFSILLLPPIAMACEPKYHGTKPEFFHFSCCSFLLDFCV